MKLKLILHRKDIEKLQVAIVVEMWKHLDSGRILRKFRETFTPKEQVIIRRRLYPVFHRWTLVTGIPDETSLLNLRYLELTKKLVHFMATI